MPLGPRQCIVLIMHLVKFVLIQWIGVVAQSVTQLVIRTSRFWNSDNCWEDDRDWRGILGLFASWKASFVCSRYQYMSEFLLSCTRPSLFLLVVLFVILDDLSFLYCLECQLAGLREFTTGVVASATANSPSSLLKSLHYCIQQTTNLNDITDRKNSKCILPFVLRMYRAR